MQSLWTMPPLTLPLDLHCRNSDGRARLGNLKRRACRRFSFARATPAASHRSPRRPSPTGSRGQASSRQIWGRCVPARALRGLGDTTCRSMPACPSRRFLPTHPRASRRANRAKRVDSCVRGAAIDLSPGRQSTALDSLTIVLGPAGHGRPALWRSSTPCATGWWRSAGDCYRRTRSPGQSSMR